MPRSKRKKRSRPQEPDEEFSVGALRVARFDKNVIWRADWQPGEHEEFQRRAAEQYPSVVAEINRIVDDIISLVSVLPPEQLLHPAWHERVGAHLDVETEVEVGHEQVLSFRMVDYIQSMIAAVSPQPVQKPTLEEHDWNSLRNRVDRLFRTLNLDYHICSAARRRQTGAVFDPHVEEFQYLAQQYWCNVTGERYQVHQVEALADVLLPQSEIIEDCLGISGEDLIEGLHKIWHSLVFGLYEGIVEMRSVTDTALAKFEKDIPERTIESEFDESQLLDTALERSGLKDQAAQAARKVCGMDLFDLQEVTDLPTPLLAELSWRPGEETDFLAEGDFRGWPLRVWPIVKRPFMQLGQRYYCTTVRLISGGRPATGCRKVG